MWVVRIVAKDFEDTGRGVKAVETVNRTNPQYPLLVSVNRGHKVATQAVRVFRVVKIASELLGLAIKGVQSGPRGNPDRPGAILKQVIDPIAAQTAWICRVVAKLNDVVSIIAIEPIDSAEPHKAGAVLQDRMDSLVGQPLLDG